MALNLHFGILQAIVGTCDLTTRISLSNASRLMRDVVAESMMGARFKEAFPKYTVDGDLEICKGIHEINLSGCKNITDEGLVHLRGVRVINLSECALITDEGLAHLRGVRVVDLSGCRNVTDRGLVHLRGVEGINLSSCDRVTDAALAHLSGVKVINLSHCTRISDEGLVHLRGVKVINLTGCSMSIIYRGLRDIGVWSGVTEVNQNWIRLNNPEADIFCSWSQNWIRLAGLEVAHVLDRSLCPEIVDLKFCHLII